MPTLFTAQHSTAQHSTAQHSTAQHSTAQHSTKLSSFFVPISLSLLLAACGGGGGSSGGQSPNTSSSNITGYIIDDAIVGAIINVYHPVNNTLLATGTSLADGSYDIPNAPAVPYRIKATGGKLNGQNFTGELTAYCDTATRCHATPYTSAIDTLVQRGLGLQQAKDMVSNRLGTSQDPFSQEVDTGTPVDPNTFNLTTARAAFNDKAALDAWILALANAAQDPNKPLPAGKPSNNNSPTTYTLSLNTPTNGSITGSTSIASGQTTSFALTPNSNYSLDYISGCNGTLSQDKTTYTTAAITANCSISANFSPSLSNQTATNGSSYNLNANNYINGIVNSYALTGALPTGLIFNRNTGVLSGTATQNGVYNISIVANYNNSTQSLPKKFTLTVSSPVPTISLSKITDAIKGMPITFTIILDVATDSTITASIGYSIPSTLPSGTVAATSGASCIGSVDYTNSITSVDILSGKTSATFAVPTCANTTSLEDKIVTVTLGSVSGNAQLSSTQANLSKDAFIYNKNAGLNDTGIVIGGNYPNGNNLGCTGETISSQDCSYGRDMTHNDNSDGYAGFSFTKLSKMGESLEGTATDFACIKDNVTGLVWENKTVDSGIHDAKKTYFWGGFGAQVSAQAPGSRWNHWDVLVNGSNSEKLCGFADWRIPSRNELLSIVNYGASHPAIDTNYFSNTQIYYWSASPFAQGGDLVNAWGVNMTDGRCDFYSRSSPLYVRLVRGGVQ